MKVDVPMSFTIDVNLTIPVVLSDDLQVIESEETQKEIVQKIGTALLEIIEAMRRAGRGGDDEESLGVPGDVPGPGDDGPDVPGVDPVSTEPDPRVTE